MSTRKKIEEPFLLELIQAIIDGEAADVRNLLATHPQLASAGIRLGATREDPHAYFFDQIKHHLYVGDTGLHAASAAHEVNIASDLLQHGANIRAKNRRGAEPLHYASDAGPARLDWNPQEQKNMITFLIDSGADPNALNQDGVSPLHRAVRTRSTAAVSALLAGGADIRVRNHNGSTPLHLAVLNTGRGGSGLAESKSEQREIVELLLSCGANPDDKDGQGKTVHQWIKEEWIRQLIG
ncbi:MAG: ankyrin repeat domain-containing protein [Cyanobacteria bacterium]|nr:ankyrin repeat domain-containing protein [Cyanobacteriota bacterium]